MSERLNFLPKCQFFAKSGHTGHSSLSEGACCTEDCNLLTKSDNFVCSDETECAHSVTCDGTQSACSNPKQKSNSNTCREGTMVTKLLYDLRGLGSKMAIATTFDCLFNQRIVTG